MTGAKAEQIHIGLEPSEDCCEECGDLESCRRVWGTKRYTDRYEAVLWNRALCVWCMAQLILET